MIDGARKLFFLTTLLAALGVAGDSQAVVELLYLGGCSGTDDCPAGGPGNLDGNVDPGESMAFDVALRNVGDEDATNVVVTAVPLTPGVTMITGSTMVGTVPAGGGGGGMEQLSYQVDETVACGTPLMFRIEIRSDQQDKDESCGVMIPLACNPCLSGADLVVTGCDVGVDTCALGAGDSNGDADPGESVGIRLSVANEGLGDATNVVATVSTMTAGVMITQDTVMLGDIPAGGGVGSMGTIDFDIDLSVPCGAEILLDVALSSNEGDFMGNCAVPVPAMCQPCAAGPVLALGDCSPTDGCALGGPGDMNMEIDPGESIELELAISNNGGSDATNVTLTASSPTPGVSVVQPSASYGTITPGMTQRPDMPIVFDVDPTVPCGADVRIDVLIESDQGDTMDVCALMVAAPCTVCSDQPALVLNGCQPTDLCPAGGPGDTNGEIDPGETVELRLGLDNLGGGDATNTVITVSTMTPGITITQDTANFGTVRAGDSANTMDRIVFDVDQTVPCGTPIALDVLIETDQGDFMDACQLMVVVACQVCDTMPAGAVFMITGRDVVTDSCAFGGAGDSNGSPEPGETVELTVDILNQGPGDATMAEATLVSLTPGVTVTQPTGSLGDLPAMAVATTDPVFEFTIDEAQVSCGDLLEFRLDFTAVEGDPLSRTLDDLFVPLPCEVCAEPAAYTAVHVASTLATDSCALGGAGDDNGEIDPGETVTFDVEVMNEGPSVATNLQLTLTAITPGVTVVTNSASVGTLASGASGSTMSPFEITLDPVALSCGDPLEFTLDFSADEGVSPSDVVDDLVVAMPCTPCSAPVAFTAVHVASSLVSDSCSEGGAGDMDGMIDPGETLTFDVSVMNQGPGDATNLMVTLAAVTPGLTVNVGTASVGTLASGASGSTMSPFEVSLGTGFACGDALEFTLSFSADEGVSPDDTVDDLAVAMPCTLCDVVAGLPEEVPEVLISCTGADLTIDWVDATDADEYRIYRGTIAALDRTLPMPYDHACIAGALMPPLSNTVPNGCDDPGNVYFLVVGVNATGEGSYGLADEDGDGAGETERPVGTGPCP